MREKEEERKKQEESLIFESDEEDLVESSCLSLPDKLDQFTNLSPTEHEKARHKSGPAGLDMYNNNSESSDDDQKYSINHKRKKGFLKVDKVVYREELLEATTSLCARGMVSVEMQTRFLASIINILGGTPHQMQISTSSIHRERTKLLEKRATIIRESYQEEMKGKHLVLHFDGKILKHLDEETNQSVMRDRVAVSISSPEFVEKGDRLLGILPTESGKAIDETMTIHNLLEYYEICEDIFAICADTTSVNTGVHSGIIMNIAHILKRPLLWFMCRHHMYEILIDKLATFYLGNTFSPERKIYKDFKNHWEKYFPIVQGALSESHTKFKKFNEKVLQTGSKLHEVYLEAQSYLKFALESETFPRDDYKHLAYYAAFYLNVKSKKLDTFNIWQPGACHNARFMADAIYILMLQITSSVIDYLDEKMQTKIEKAAFICAMIYAPSFLKSYKPEYAVQNDFMAFKVSHALREEFDENLGSIFQKFFLMHPWYLTPKVIPMILADPDFNDKEKVLSKLLAFPIPDLDSIPIEKPGPVPISPDTQPEDLITEESWVIFKFLKLENEVQVKNNKFLIENGFFKSWTLV